MANPSKEDLAYAAGIIDGEGCIIIIERCRKNIKGRQYLDFYLRVQVQTTDTIICPWLHKAFGGSLRTIKVDNPKWKDKCHWEMNSRSAASFLTSIFPFLKLKKPNAKIALRFQQTFLTADELRKKRVGSKWGHYRTPDDVLMTRRSVREELLAITRPASNGTRKHYV